MTTRVFLHIATLCSPGFLIVSLIAPVGFALRKRHWMLGGALLILTQAAADSLHWPIAAGFTALAVIAGSIVVLARGLREHRRFRAAWLQRWNNATPIALHPPFVGDWKALNTGPSVASNHHLAARDQWFAVDWVRQDAPSRASQILSPVEGVVAVVEDGHPDKPNRRWIQRDPSNPAGNYISIRAAAGEAIFVILAHLGKGSILVSPGQSVAVGEPVARCGNSGNTSVSHLHIHAQPAERVAPGAVWGIPIVFADRNHAMRSGERLRVREP
ncbi:MAG: M23 family metallopeptidase [Acidobacteriaceae bacterium]